MPADLSRVDAFMAEATGRIFPAAQLEVRQAGRVRLSRAYGWIDPEAQRCPTTLETRFDLASVTKLFVVTAAMRLLEAGALGLDQPVREVLPDFDGLRPIQPYEDPLNPGGLIHVETAGAGKRVDAGRVTFRHLLVHNSGLPAWRRLYAEPDAAAALRLALTTPFAYEPGTRVVYSDIGLILLGLALERLTGQPLDVLVAERVTRPLGLARTAYRPQLAFGDDLEVAPTEICAWRGRRVQGEVHDENAAGLGGVAGHAGLFSTAADVAAFGQMYLEQGRPLLKPETVAAMTRVQAEDGLTRRGLGFQLRPADPEGSGQPLSLRAFGHTGFTGTSLWIDPERALVVACLTNEVYHGRADRKIIPFRLALHRTVVAAIEAEANA